MVIRDNVARGAPKGQTQEETTDMPGIQQWNKGLRLKGTAMLKEGEDIQQDLQEDHSAGSREASSQVFQRAVESE
jgi:hypothetical protein